MQEVAAPTQPFPRSLDLTPSSRLPLVLPRASVQAVLTNPIPMSLAHYDVVCFPSDATDLRPRSLPPLVEEFARQGHRVFALTRNTSLPNGTTGRFRCQSLAPNVVEVEIAATDALAAMRRAFGIETAVSYLPSPSWDAAALSAAERWGWTVMYHRPNPENVPGNADGPIADELTLVRDADIVIEPGAALGRRNQGQFEWRDIHGSRSRDVASWAEIDRAIRHTFKRVSIVLVTFNNLVFNRLCIESLLANTEYPNYEIVVVDNGSTDGTVPYLRELVQRHRHIRLVCNADNRGFASASNQGLAIAQSDALVLLNNDTVVPPGWLTRLVRYLEHPSIGLVGPVTNRIGNEAQIDVSYRTYGELVHFAHQYTQRHEGQCFDIRTPTMFCLAMRRDVFEQLGSLDEQFEIGMLEDDDFARRARSAGYRTVCAEDVFVHHFDKASFGQLVPTGEYARLLHANRQRFKEKWGAPWEPYRHRFKPRYRRLVDRVREVVRCVVPPDATVIVVSKGDRELLKLDGRPAWHFPRLESGVYAGHYPADSAEAIAHLEDLRAKGAGYLLFPETACWWLDHYVEFKSHLERRYPLVIRRDDTCLIFALDAPNSVPPGRGVGGVPQDPLIRRGVARDQTRKSRLDMH